MRQLTREPWELRPRLGQLLLTAFRQVRTGLLTRKYTLGSPDTGNSGEPGPPRATFDLPSSFVGSTKAALKKDRCASQPS